MYPPDNWTNVNWSIAQLQFVQLEIWSIVTLFNNFLINWFLLDCWFDHLTYVQSVFWSIDFCSVSFLLNCFVQLFLFNLVLVNRHGRSLTNPYFHLTILLSVSQQPNEEKEEVGICHRIKASKVHCREGCSHYPIVNHDLVAPNSDYRIVRSDNRTR